MVNFKNDIRDFQSKKIEDPARKNRLSAGIGGGGRDRLDFR